ncbi:MAG TPA: Holliday junction branch migration DNA helicase RuvB, partial [Gammaproteobacteria bacterium]|nr:Holliday junction branch migration DNA helicase RuvB [Gammaproteobacteria bacterium]
QQGFMLRTPRGRMATKAAYLHLGLPVTVRTEGAPDLFDALGNGT